MKSSSPRRISSALQTLDRRADERRPKNTVATMWLTPNDAVVVNIVDESDAGVGVDVPAQNFEIGFQVRLECDGRRRTASIVYVRELDEENHRLGLAWV